MMENKEQEKWSKAVNMINRMDESEGKHLNFVEHGNNKNPLVPLNESDIAKYLDRHTDLGYIIISACRNMEHTPEIQNITNQDEKVNAFNRINNERTKELADLIRQHGFAYKQVFGSYQEKGSDAISYEKSFLVLPHGNSKENADFQALDKFGLEMCRKFEQDSYLRVSPNGTMEYITQQGENDGTFMGKTYNKYDTPYFTDLHKNSDKYVDSNDMNAPARPTRFTLTEVYVNPRPPHLILNQGNVLRIREFADWNEK